MVGIGTAWRDSALRNSNNMRLEPYITGRMASFMVALSPSFDEPFRDALDSIAAELRKTTSHLVTQHPGTIYQANLSYRNSMNVDFSGLQSGHHGGDILKVYNAARVWTTDMWNGVPVKPVLNIEAMYDAYGHDNAKNWREKDSRKTGWITWMSGAKGFTYGCGDVPPKVPGGHGGIWRFNRDSTTYDLWKKAINWPSAFQMTFMANFMKSIEWWKLQPCPEIILNQEQNDTLSMVASKYPHGGLIIAYLPGNSKVILNMSVFRGSYSCAWFNPKTGTYTPDSHITAGSMSRVFIKPDGWDDAVLTLKKSGS
jgi:hypothetical protein